MTENTSTTTEETTTCKVGACEGPVVTNLWDDEDRYCEAHQRVVDADEIYGDWLRAHDTRREQLASYLDKEDPGTLEEIFAQAMNQIKRECARWMAEHEEFQVGDRRITPEKAESAHRTLTRSDRLGEAIEVVYRADLPEGLCKADLAEGKRWAILAALYEAKDEADEELARFRGEQPA